MNNIQYETFGFKVGLVANTILNVTRIVTKAKGKSIEPLGCGLLLQIDNEYFLISAGHLLNIKDWPELMIPGANNKVVYLNGILATPFSEPSDNNRIDFAVFKFSQRQIKHLIDHYYRSLKEYHVLINHKLKNDDSYIISGYPVNGVRVHGKGTLFTPTPLKLVTYPVNLSKYAPNGFDSRIHILVKYQRKLKPFGKQQRQITTEPLGISGSGLWFVPDWNKTVEKIPQFFLVGIMIENFKHRGFLVTIRIDFISETIKRVFGIKRLTHSKLNLEEILNNLYIGEIP